MGPAIPCSSARESHLPQSYQTPLPLQSGLGQGDDASGRVLPYTSRARTSRCLVAHLGNYTSYNPTKPLLPSREATASVKSLPEVRYQDGKCVHVHETGQSGSRQRPIWQSRMCDLGLGVARLCQQQQQQQLSHTTRPRLLHSTVEFRLRTLRGLNMYSLTYRDTQSSPQSPRILFLLQGGPKYSSLPLALWKTMSALCESGQCHSILCPSAIASKPCNHSRLTWSFQSCIHKLGTHPGRA